MNTFNGLNYSKQVNFFFELHCKLPLFSHVKLEFNKWLHFIHSIMVMYLYLTLTFFIRSRWKMCWARLLSLSIWMLVSCSKWVNENCQINNLANSRRKATKTKKNSNFDKRKIIVCMFRFTRNRLFWVSSSVFWISSITMQQNDFILILLNFYIWTCIVFSLNYQKRFSFINSIKKKSLRKKSSRAKLSRYPIPYYIANELLIPN